MDGKILGCVRMLVVGYWLWTDLVVCSPRRMKMLGFLVISVSIACLVNSSQSDGPVILPFPTPARLIEGFMVFIICLELGSGWRNWPDC
jgi:hypothetical protein